MRGWLLYRYTLDTIPADKYEILRLVDEARREGIALSVVTPQQFDLIVTRDDRKSVRLDNCTTPLPDFLLPRLGSGTTYFALAVIRHLERLGVQVINSSHSIETVKDKLFTQQILAESNLPFPKTMLAQQPVDPDKVGNLIGYPVVVKTLTGSLGTGVYLCETPEKLCDLMDFIDATQANANIILQEYIADSHGRDLRVLVIGGEAVSCVQRQSTDGSFKANFSRGGFLSEYTISAELGALASAAARVLNLDVAGVDLLFAGDHFMICEVNSSPGFEGMELVTDLNVPRAMYQYIRARLSAHPLGLK